MEWRTFFKLIPTIFGILSCLCSILFIFAVVSAGYQQVGECLEINMPLGLGTIPLCRQAQAPQPTQIVLQGANTVSPSVTSTTPTSITPPTSTLIPTSITLPTYTPNPTYTPVPISPTESLNLPFFDDFNIGLNPSWKVIRGVPVITDGHLKPAGDPIGIEIGSSLNGNYVVEFDYYYTRWCCSTAYFEIVLGSKLKLTHTNNNLVWSAFQENRWIEITQNPHDRQDTAKNMKIQIFGNTYEVYINGQLFSQIIYGDSFQGPVTISFDDAVWIDNLSIAP